MMPPLVLRPPVLVGWGVPVEPEDWELGGLTTEERTEEREELETGGVEVDDDVLVMDEGRIEEELRVELGGVVDVTVGMEGIVVGLSRQISVEPALTVITGV
jgi:hypothetical protein